MNRTLWRVALIAAALASPAQAASVRYVHTDSLGSVVAKTDENRVVLERREYEPYGRQLVPGNVQDGPGYTGHVQDAVTGLTYMQQRYYDPAIGRFLSVDPVTIDAVRAANFNRYWYGNNNPYRYFDPDGRCTAIADATPETAPTAICQDATELNLSDNGGRNITGFEGYSTEAYQVGSDKPTIGIGHTDGVELGDTMTEEEVESAFMSDVAVAERTVEHLVGDLPVSQQEFDALVDLAFNVGGPKLNAENSPGLNRAIAEGDYAAIGANLRYTRGPDGPLRGLVDRSNSRQAIFNSGDYQQGLERYDAVMRQREH